MNIMRQAIVTKYFGATNHRGPRIKATASSGLSVTVPWDYDFNVEDNHVFAARKLAEKLSWTDGTDFDDWVGGSLKLGYVFVYVHPAIR
jgi:hypothetical protein